MTIGGQADKSDQPETRPVKRTKFFTGPEPLRHGRPRKDGEKRLAENCAAGAKKSRKQTSPNGGTVSGSDAGTNRVARATLRTIFRPRSGLRFARLVVDLRFVAAKVVPDYADAR